MHRKVFTLDSLYDYYVGQGRSFNFNARDADVQVFVRVPSEAIFEDENSADDEDDTRVFRTVKIMHSGKNRNQSILTDEALIKSGETLAYKPLLADIENFTDEETGETFKDFTSHALHFNDDGEIVYDEHGIGCFTTDDPVVKKDPNNGRNYLYGRCAIWKDYTDAIEVLERKGGTKVSVELLINEMTYAPKSQTLKFTDVTIMGVTCLGRNPETGEKVEEGMEGAKMQFSKEGGKQEEMNNKKLEELLLRYNKKAEDLKFDTKDLSDSDLEKKFSEEFGNSVVSVTLDGQTKTFAKSMVDKIHDLTKLVNSTYEDDNTWYDVVPYDDQGYLIMRSYSNDSAYRVEYKVGENGFELSGDRVEVHPLWVTNEEESAADEVREKYSSLQEDFSALNEQLADANTKIKNYEEEPKKMEVLNSKSYQGLDRNKEFKKLREINNHFNMSIEEVSQKADALLLDAFKKNTLDLEGNSKSSQKSNFSRVNVPTDPKRGQSRYGSLMKAMNKAKED